MPAKALADTTDWLARPQQWDRNGGDPAFSDKGLARIQFAAALVEALDAGLTRDREALKRVYPDLPTWFAGGGHVRAMQAELQGGPGQATMAQGVAKPGSM